MITFNHSTSCHKVERCHLTLFWYPLYMPKTDNPPYLRSLQQSLEMSGKHLSHPFQQLRSTNLVSLDIGQYS